ncbi:HupE/UreJ family protein [Emcibacter sp. SYSU 3D8]|uniref:HupE/UreJ family protein n=1 Tax=Emcibacter sp. SYSU 3D8 TaxID=3133969 RepID=UPI0031FF44E9
MFQVRQILVFSCLTILALPGVAIAHVAAGDLHYHTFGDGLVHAITGLDHVFVAVLVGLWAAWRPVKSSGLALGLYAVSMVLPGQLGLGGEFTMLDILLVCAGIAVMIGFMLKGGDRLLMALVLTAASLQGFIHGMAASGSGNSPAFMAGLTSATMAVAIIATIASLKFELKALR